MLFEIYLVRCGAVTCEQFVDALEARFAAQSPIGQIALREKKLSVKQVSEILSEQANSPKMFGEIAIEKGYLTDLDIHDLLARQKAQLESLANIFIRRGLLTEKDRGRHLAAFRDEIVHSRLVCG